MQVIDGPDLNCLLYSNNLSSSGAQCMSAACYECFFVSD